MLSPHFVCLSMIVSRRAWATEPMPLAAVDCLAYALERENDPPSEWPPLVQKSLDIFGYKP